MIWYSLCYHYFFNQRTPNKYKRIIANDIDLFYQFVQEIDSSKEFVFLSHTDLLQKNAIQSKAILLTFDDGLSSQFLAAEILHSLNIRAIFFPCTCLFDNIPANPMIIHHCLSEFGIKKFLEYYNYCIEALGSAYTQYRIYPKENVNVYDVIGLIKYNFKFNLGPMYATQILHKIYQDYFVPVYGDDISDIHLSPLQLKQILDMGHAIGCHTHNHIVINDTIDSQMINEQIISSKQILETNLGTDIRFFAYPFGAVTEVFSKERSAVLEHYFDYAFTTAQTGNIGLENQYSLSRYCVDSRITPKDLIKHINRYTSL